MRKLNLASLLFLSLASSSYMQAPGGRTDYCQGYAPTSPHDTPYSTSGALSYLFYCDSTDLTCHHFSTQWPEYRHSRSTSSWGILDAFTYRRPSELSLDYLFRDLFSGKSLKKSYWKRQWPAPWWTPYDSPSVLSANLSNKINTKPSLIIRKNFSLPPPQAVFDSQTFIQKQQRVIDIMICGFALVLATALLLLYLFRLKRKQKLLLEEKNLQIATLNGELNHRVKNNLMFVSSLMRLQARRLNSPEAKVAFKETENRVEAMAMIHRKLSLQSYRSSIEMYDYLQDLCQFLYQSYALNEALPSIELLFGKISLETEKALQIGLIINELVTNSFKHAFHDQKQPKITVSLRRKENQQILLTYADNGIGLPDHFNWQSTSSLGFRLVQDLSLQLDGELQIRNRSGTSFTLLFPDYSLR